MCLAIGYDVIRVKVLSEFETRCAQNQWMIEVDLLPWCIKGDLKFQKLVYMSLLAVLMMMSSNGNISALRALCERNPPFTGGFHSQRTATRSFDLLFDVRLNKRLYKQSRFRWFETSWRSLSRHCNVCMTLQTHCSIVIPFVLASNYLDQLRLKIGIALWYSRGVTTPDMLKVFISKLYQIYHRFRNKSKQGAQTSTNTRFEECKTVWLRSEQSSHSYTKIIKRPADLILGFAPS